MASKKHPDLESQKLAPSPVVVAATTLPPSNDSGRIALDSIAVAINDEHDSAGAYRGDNENGVWADDETTRLERTVARAFQSTAELARAFDVLSPFFTNSGMCADVDRVHGSETFPSNTITKLHISIYS
jgi:hypothetical protein